MKTNRRHTSGERGLSALLVLAIAMLGCPPATEPISVEPGLVQVEQNALVPFRHGTVNAIGGNVNVGRVDLSIDTRIGTIDIGATYNSAARGWLFGFDSTYDPDTGVFMDETGATYELATLPDGAAYPGSTWVKLGVDSIRTKHGRVYDFDADGRLEAVYWADRSYPRIVHQNELVAGAPHTTRVDQCTDAATCTLVYTVTYDGSGRVVAIDDRAGRRAEFTWDVTGLVNARDGLDVEEARPGFTYENDGGLLVSITNGEGERTELEYEEERAVSVRDGGPGYPEQTFHYGDRNGGFYATRHWNALGQERQFHYDHDRRLQRVLDVTTGEEDTWAWSEARPISHTTPAGVTTRWTWADDDLETEIQPSGNVVRYWYAPDATDRTRPHHRPLARVEDNLGLIERRTYGTFGEIIEIENGAGEVTQRSYAADWQSLTHPSGVVIYHAEYGEQGHPGFVGTDLELAGQRRGFDAVGNVTHGNPIDEPETGGVIERSYDADRNLSWMTLDSGDFVHVARRSDGQPTYVSRPGGDHVFEYDAMGRIWFSNEWVDGNWAGTSYDYDAMGRSAAVSRPNGMRQELAYDSQGRQVRMTNLRYGQVEGTVDLVYEDGRLVSATDSIRGTTQEFEYDAAGRVVRILHGDGSETWRTYDLRSRLTQEQYVLEGNLLVRSIGYGYDAADRRVEVRDGEDVVLNRTYEADRQQQIDYGNGLSRTFFYDGNGGFQTQSRTVDAALALVESTLLERGVDEATATSTTRITTSTWGGVDATTVEQYVLGPVENGGVAQGVHLVSSGSGGAARAFAWDDVSNLLSEGSTTFTYNAEKNRLQSISGPAGDIDYTYDNAGFTTSRAGKPITWHANGRIASHGADTFAWDVSGLLISSVVEGVETTSLFGGRVIGTAAGVPARIDLGDVVIDLGTSERRYRHFDVRGNVKFTTDEAGDVRSHYGYTAHRVETVHGEDDDPVRFVGRGEIGELMILGERVYDPASGRFLSQDPIFNLLSQYAYTHRNPIWFQDRDGTESSLAKGAAAFELMAATAFAIAFATAPSPVSAAFLHLALQFSFIAALLRLIDAWGLIPGSHQDGLRLNPSEGSGFKVDDGGTIRCGGGDSFGDGVQMTEIGGVGGIGCAPSSAARSPHLPAVLAALLPLQALLGVLVLRRRRRDALVRQRGSA